MNLRILITISFLALVSVSNVQGSLAIINLLRESVAGRPEFHQKQSWPFNPDVAARRQVDFEKLNGYRSLDLIERIGLGEDGRQDERRIQQAIRDQGIPITGKR